MKLPKVYEPAQYESDIYALWEKKQAFAPQGDGESYSLVVPPPNANGDLHIGTAFTLMIEDIIARHHRILGDRTMFVPGADHAGFETWVVYEKKLAAEGKSRFDFTREQLYEQVWNFVANNRKDFELQFRRLGASVDWPHFTFSLDDKVVRQAYNTFKRMWDEGLIYRGERLVNFCTFHGTSFADIEVEYKEEQGKLWYINYPLTDGSGAITVATTRPETLLGDTGVAVNPTDSRYQNLSDKTVLVPIVGREVPIVADTFVDPKFGTGAVKLTPAHDYNDYDTAKRHGLSLISVITHEGRMADSVPEPYRHLPVAEAREKIVKDLERQKLISKVEDYKHNVGHCYKCGTVIEPLLRQQWFIDVGPLAKPAIAALEAGEIKFYPEAKKEQLIAYLQKLKDWNISRQIAWGIPIPAFQNVDDPDDWIYDEHIDDEIIAIGDKTYRRDPDVFDTWFSSGSWPYVTLGYPNHQDFKDFYPLSLMETGSEILYPWVGRMIMLGLYVTGKIPFENVYLHGYVLAEDGSKMSKSVGNVVNPSEFVNEYGSDALRMGLIAGRAPAVNRGFDKRRVEEARNFCNKVWNIARFTESIMPAGFKRQKHTDPQTAADYWILTKLQQTYGTVQTEMAAYRISEAYDSIYHFIWDDFADWYIETAKVKLNPNILAFVLESSLSLLHPFAPFLTETIWQTLAWEPDSLLAVKRWPEIPSVKSEQVNNFEEVKTIISEVRYIKSALKIKKTKLHYIAPAFITESAELIERLAGVKAITEVQLSPGLRLINSGYQCWLDVESKLLESYKQELVNRRKTQQATVNGLERRLANPDYIAKAPAPVREQSRQQLQEAEQILATIEQEFKRFEPSETVHPEQQPAQTQAQPARQPSNQQTAGTEQTPPQQK